jgi:hypothetical protein
MWVPPASGGTVLHGVPQAGGIGAVRATEHVLCNFHPVTDDPAQAMTARRRHRLYRTLEAIEDVPLPLNENFKAFVVFVPALFACSHRKFLPQISILRTDLRLGA